MIKAYKYRIYPNNEQKELIAKHFGACRFLYNLALETKIAAYSSGVNLSRYDLQVQLKDLKQECIWLKEINAQSLQSSLMHLDGAYLKFFKGLAKFPVFKKKTGRGSFQCPQNVSIENGLIYLPKFNTGIKIAQSRLFDGEMRTVTISKTPTNKYFASILVQDNKKLPKTKKVKEKTAVGIDLGIKTFAVLKILSI
jgi:putative transposase